MTIHAQAILSKCLINHTPSPREVSLEMNYFSTRGGKSAGSYTEQAATAAAVAES